MRSHRLRSLCSGGESPCLTGEGSSLGMVVVRYENDVWSGQNKRRIQAKMDLIIHVHFIAFSGRRSHHSSRMMRPGRMLDKFGPVTTTLP